MFVCVWQCFRLTVASDPSHAEAYANLGVLGACLAHKWGSRVSALTLYLFVCVLEHRKGDLDQADLYYQAAVRHAPHLYEPHFNRAVIFHSRGA